MSLTQQERKNLLKTIEIASGGAISTNEANQVSGKVISVEKALHIAEQCYKEGVRNGLLQAPIQYRLIDILQVDYDEITGMEEVRPITIKAILTDMMQQFTLRYDKDSSFNPRFDSHIRLLLTMLVDMAEMPTTDAYTIIQETWERIFKQEEQEPCVDINIVVCTGYSRMMVVLNNDDIKRSGVVGGKDFKDIVDYLITIYKELHNDIIITKLTELSVEEFKWKDYQTYIKCIEGDNSPITRAYVEEIIDVLEKDHIVGMMSTSDKIDCLNNCIDNYYDIPLDGFDSDINAMTTY